MENPLHSLSHNAVLKGSSQQFLTSHPYSRLQGSTLSSHST